MAFEWPLRVYIEDTDFGGIVYYVNYLKFMERARTEMLRECGSVQSQLAQDQVIFVVHHAECTYHQPARLDDELIVSSAIEQPGSASVNFNQRIIRRSDNRLMCEGRVRVACLNSGTMRPRRWPVELLAALKKFQ